MASASLILCGHQGRMGRAVKELSTTFTKFSSVHEFPVTARVQGDAVLVDFSSPEGFRSALDYCTEHRVPFVSGTTGLSESDFESLNSAAKKIPVLWASNMSLGVHWFKKAIATLGPIAEKFEFQIEEVHHKRKVDAPSGTAIDLQFCLESVVKNPVPQPVSIRGGGVFGVHRLLIMGEEETMTIEHLALDRKVFARGALMAAEYLINKSPGRYSMDAVLGLDK